MKNIIIPPLSMPVTEFASQGNALLGIKGSGKSYGAMQIAESTGYQANGGGFNNAIYHLRGLGLIDGKNDLKASDSFFQ